MGVGVAELLTRALYSRVVLKHIYSEPFVQTWGLMQGSWVCKSYETLW